MKILKIIELCRNFRKDCKSFRLVIAMLSFSAFFAQRIKCKLSDLLLRERNKRILNYLKHKYSDVINNMKDIADNGIDGTNNRIIWVCWWQGKDNMDALTKSCLDSIVKHSNGAKVIMITKDNYSEYANIPNHIISKLNHGIISFTHFSDILRMNLLYFHGGFWLDVTVLLTADVPNELFTTPLFSRKGEKYGFYVSDCKWAGFMIGGQKGCILFQFMCEMFNEYWKRENRLIDYYLIDYLIKLGYMELHSIHSLIDAIPYNNPQLHSLEKLMNVPYNESEFHRITTDTSFHKLSRKAEHHKTADGMPTFYAYLLDGKLS